MGFSLLPSRPRHEAAFAGVPTYMPEAMVRSYVETAAHQKIDPGVLDLIIAPWLGPEGQPAFYRQIAQSSQLYTDEVQDRYQEIDDPTVVLWGEQDSWIPIDRGLELAAAIGNARFESIPDADHLVIEERPDELWSHIQRFLSEQRS